MGNRILSVVLCFALFPMQIPLTAFASETAPSPAIATSNETSAGIGSTAGSEPGATGELGTLEKTTTTGDSAESDVDDPTAAGSDTDGAAGDDAASAVTDSASGSSAPTATSTTGTSTSASEPASAATSAADPALAAQDEAPAITVQGDKTISIEDADGGRQKISGQGDDVYVTAGTSITLTTGENKNVDSHIVVKATGKVNLIFKSLDLRCDDGSPLEIFGDNEDHDVTISLWDTSGASKCYSSGLNRPGISVPKTAVLTIQNYSYSITGSLEATGDKGAAGIGGEKGHGCGNISILSGTVTATGGSNGAGIGSGDGAGAMGTIYIKGGDVTATGGDEAAGIGSGNDATHPGKITIDGGNVTASCSGAYGAGIGGGDKTGGGTVTINGGTVNATGGSGGAGIGSGDGGGDTGSGKVTINGGTVTATGGDEAAGIGSGNEAGRTDEITITGGSVQASCGALKWHQKETIYGVMIDDTTYSQYAESDYGAGIGGGDQCDGGTVSITGGYVSSYGGTRAAGIGGGDKGDGGDVSIRGGANVTAQGGKEAAGIGSGNEASSSGKVVISDGEVLAASGSHAALYKDGDGGSPYGQEGAGIGGGDEVSGADVTISGGTVKASGGAFGAGIGGGEHATGGTCTITGGSVMAWGAAGAGIGGGKGASADSVTISGGYVQAMSTYSGAGIGGGEGSSVKQGIRISGGIVIARGGSTKYVLGGGAGIGGGNGGGAGGGVEITGGTVNAYGATSSNYGGGGAGIGGGYEGRSGVQYIKGGTVYAVAGGGAAGIGNGGNCSTIAKEDLLEITGGTVLACDGTSDAESVTHQPTNGTSNVYRYLVTLDGTADGTSFENAVLKKSDGTVISGYGTNDILTMQANRRDGDGSLYLYLPHDAGATSADLGTVTNADNVVYSKSADDSHFYELPAITVHYNANGGNGTMVDGTLRSSDHLAKHTFTKKYYTFMGWSTSPSSTVAEYADEALAVDVLGNDQSQTEITLYAVWKESSEKLWYSAEDSSMGTVSPTSESIDLTDFTPNGSTATARDGYHFSMWVNSKGQLASTDSHYAPPNVWYAAWSSYSFTAEFQPNVYSVTFYINNGSELALQQTGIEYGNTVTLRKNTYARDGYTFTGWNTSEDGTGTAYTDEASVKNLTTKDGGTVYLYAQWKPNSHACSFTLNDPDATYDALPASTSQEAAFDSLLTEPSVSKKGYVLEGFYTDEVLTQKWDFATDKMPDANVDLYAKWDPAQDSAYTVEFWRSLDGGSTYRQVVSDTLAGAAATASSVDATASAYVGKYEGFTLQAGKTAYADSAHEASTRPLVVKGDGSLVMRLYFDANTYTVRFDDGVEDGGVSGTMADQKMTYGTAGTLAVNTFSRAGYRFLGWKVAGSDPARFLADKAPVADLTTVDDAVVTLTAMWEAYPDAVLSYNAADPAQGTVTRAVDKLARGVGAQDSPGTVTATAKSGYRFTGWTLYGSTVVVSADAELTQDDMKETSAWSGDRYVTTAFVAGFAPNAYAVEFNANGGTGTMTAQQMTYGTPTALTASSFTRTGYSFAGWNTQDDGGGISYADAASVKNLAASGSIILYAQWTADLVVSYAADDAAHGSVTIGSESVKSGENAIGSTAQAAEGYRFVKWVDKDGNVASDEAAFAPAGVAASAAYTAVFDANTYTVSFANGADDATGGMPGQQMTYGTAGTLTANGFSRAGYRFLGWQVSGSDPARFLADGASVTDLTTSGSITLTAMWEAYPDAVLSYNAADPAQGSVDRAMDKLARGVGAQDSPGTVTATAKSGYHSTGWTVHGTNPAIEASADAELIQAEIKKTSAWSGDRYVTTAFVAGFAPNAYAVEFNANGGTGTMTAQQMTYGTPTAFTVNAFTRTGYTFAGWNTAADGKGTLYGNGAEALNLATGETGHESVTLYAQWAPNPYTVRFNANGGAGTMSVQEIVYDTKANLNSNLFSRTGYTFKGWNTAADGGGTSFAAGAQVSNLGTGQAGDASVTLYAQWKANTYKVRFDANGGAGDMSAQEIVYDTKANLNSNLFSRTGYTFKGWNTAADGGGTSFAAGAQVSNLGTGQAGDASVTLYAQWKANTYKVRFDANGGAGTTMPDQQMAYDGGSAELAKNTYTRTDHAFMGWSTDGDSTTAEYVDGQQVANLTSEANGIVNLYAVWSGVSASIAYVPSVAGKATVSPAAQVAGASAPATGATARAALGYHFVNWTNDLDATVAADPVLSAETVDAVAHKGGVYADTTFTANIQANTYTVEYNANGAEGSMESQRMTYDQAANLADNGFTASSGYSFAGWNTEEGGSGTSYADCAKVSNLTAAQNGTVTLWAQWEQDAYNVSWDANDPDSSYDAIEAPTAVQATYGSYVTVPGMQKKGYALEGFYTDEALTDRWDFASDTVTGDMTLYAKWAPAQDTGYAIEFYRSTDGGSAYNQVPEDVLALSAVTGSAVDVAGYADRYTGCTYSHAAYADSATTAASDALVKGDGSLVVRLYYIANAYTVAFDANGGAGAMAGRSMVYGVAASLPPCAFTRADHPFISWNTERDGSGTTYIDAASVKSLSDRQGATVTLYAQWSEVERATITYVAANAAMGVVSPASERLLPLTGTAKGSTATAKDGYHFTGWADASGALVSADAKLVLAKPQGGFASTTYTATFAPNSYTVAFDDGVDDDSVEGTMGDQAMKYGTAENLDANKFARAGYTFVGWQVEKTDRYAADKASVSDLATEDGAQVTLVAVWRAMPDALISYTSADASQGTVGVAYDLLVRGVGTETSPAGATAAANAGYHFTSWTLYGSDPARTVGTNPSLMKAQISAVALNVSTGLYSSANLVANFAPNSYTVAFDDGVDDGSVEGTMGDQVMEYGTAEDLDANKFERVGYTFVGWQVEKTGRYAADKASVSNLTDENNGTVTLYAQWREVPKVTLAYVSANAAMGTVAPASESLLPTAQSAAGATAAAKVGYRFTNWTDASGAIVSTEAKLVPQRPQGGFASTAYTANFAANVYTVAFDDGVDDGSVTGTMDAQSGFAYGTPKALSANAFKRSGYAFVGWQVGDTGRYVADKANVSDLATDDGARVTLVAVWRAMPDVLITYTSADPSQGTVGSAYDLLLRGVGTETSPAGTVATAKDGYHFTGWTLYGSDPARTVGTNPSLAKAQIDAVAFDASTGLYSSANLVANFAPNTYTVAFDANATDAKGTMTDQDGFAYGTPKALNANAYARTGYTFSGWNTSENGSGKSYADGEKVSDLSTTENGKVTLYAQWVESGKALLSYRSSDASMGTVSPIAESLLRTAESAQGSTATAKDGYHFTGWADASGALVSADAKLVLAKPQGGFASTTYTATFAPNSYTVAFDDGVDDDSVEGTMGDQAMKYGTAENLDANKFARAGYTFVGWQVEKTDRYAADKASVSDLATEDGAQVTLVAVWRAMPDALISYTSADASQGTVGVAYDLLVRGVGTETSPAGTVATAKDGYHFTGWTLYGSDPARTVGTAPTLMKAQIDAVAFDASTGLYSSANLVADFAANTYTVAFDDGVGDGSVEGTMGDQVMEYGTAEDLDANKFERVGYTFVGWQVEKTGRYAADKASVSNLTDENNGTVKLHAQWREVERATITYVAANAAMGTVAPASESLLPTAQSAAGATAAAKAGYRFTNWTDASGAIVSTSTEFAPQRPQGGFASTTYAANFEGMPYSVRFNANGGEGYMDDQAMAYGTIKSLSANAFKRAGYRFVGWQLERSGRFVADGTQVSDLSANGKVATLYAVWQPLPDALISYTPEDAAQGTVGKPFELLAQGAGTPTGTVAAAKDGYHFTSWTLYGSDPVRTVTTEPVLAKEQIDAEALEGDYYSTTDFLANFAPNAYTVAFDANAADATGTMPVQSMVYGESENLSANAFVRTDHVFTGWNTDAQGAGDAYVDGESVESLTAKQGATVTLYAQWSEVPKVTLAYASADAARGSVSSAIEALLPEVGVPAGSVALPEAGYHFTKWTDSSEAIVSTDAKLVPQKAGAAFVAEIYTAHFEANAYTVSFDANATDAAGDMADQALLYGTPQALAPNAFSRAGHTFTGWNTAADGGGRAYADGQDGSAMAAQDGEKVVLYAQWRADDAPAATGGSGSEAASDGSGASGAQAAIARSQATPASGDAVPIGAFALVAGIVASTAALARAGRRPRAGRRAR